MDRWTLPCGCTYKDAVCEQGKELVLRCKEVSEQCKGLLEVEALTSAQAHIRRTEYRAALRAYDNHFSGVRGYTLLSRSDEPAVYVFSDDRITVVPSDSGFRSYIGTREECLAWLQKKYPYAVEVETREELDNFYIRRYEQYWPELIEREKLYVAE